MNFEFNYFKLSKKLVVLIIPILIFTLSSCELFNNETNTENIIREITSEDQINQMYQKAKDAYLWFCPFLPYP